MDDCIFCRIVKHDAPSITVYEDAMTLGFLDHYPLNPGHTLVIPKRHYETMREMPLSEVGGVFVSVAKVMRGVFKATKADGINIGQSNGVAASQEVFHMHVHVIPRHTGDSPAGFTFPERKRSSLGEMERIGAIVRDAVARETS